MYRLIEKNEIKKAAKLMADAFIDYPLYKELFPNEKKMKKGIYYFCWYRIYARRSYTRVSPDFAKLFSLKTPSDKEKTPLGLLFNPKFFFGLISSLTRFSIKRLKEFSKLEEKYQKQYYDPNKDNYLQVICIDKKVRNGMDEIMDLLKEVNAFLGKRNTYSETHTILHERLYRMFGAKTLAKEDFHGCTHIVMIKNQSDSIQ
ncbi:MAG: hypothetical protein MJ214_03135 [Bacilli bacterium]|nr:hypothetical protein [Bacilli bacterium]